MEYELKCQQLKEMISTYADELNNYEQELTDKINCLENPTEIDGNLANLKNVYQNLLDLQDSMEKVLG